jgi:hypothetical protein
VAETPRWWRVGPRGPVMGAAMSLVRAMPVCPSLAHAIGRISRVDPPRVRSHFGVRITGLALSSGAMVFIRCFPGGQNHMHNLAPKGALRNTLHCRAGDHGAVESSMPR